MILLRGRPLDREHGNGSARTTRRRCFRMERSSSQVGWNGSTTVTTAEVYDPALGRPFRSHQ